MKSKRKKGFTMFELLTAILILSIISFIGVVVHINLSKKTKDAFYNSLEGKVSLAGRDYFSDHIDERPDDTDFASLIEINGRRTEKNLEKKAYVTKVLDMKKNECPGKVISYLDVDSEYTYVSCLECEDYQSTNRICGCEEETIVDEETGEEYTTCKLDEIPAPTLTTVTVNEDKTTSPYKSYGAPGEEFTYDDALWTAKTIRITYTTGYKYAKKIRVEDETGKVMDNMSCELKGSSTKTCTKDVTTTTYGTFKAYIVDDLNRLSSTGVKEFYIKIDKTVPEVKIIPYDTKGQKYTYDASKASSTNLDLTLDVKPAMAPSGYTYKWYYSTDLTNGSNKVLITEIKVNPDGKFTTIVPAPTTGEEEEESEDDEITNVDTSQGVVGYKLDKEDMSLFVNAPREKLIARKYIVEITTGVGNKGTTNQNVRINRPKAICTITAKKSDGSNYKSGAWSNKDVTLTCNISNPLYTVKRWTKRANVAGSEKNNIQNTSPSLKVSSISNKAGDIYTVVVGLVDNTDQEESEEFIVKIDKVDPKCGKVSGSSTSWTKKSRTISVKCSDDLSGCKNSSYSKTYSSSTKTGSITIKDKAGNTKSCSVNVYVDKTAPSVSMKCDNNCSGNEAISRTCYCTVSASDSYSGVSYKKYAVGYSCGTYKTYTRSFEFYPAKYVACAYAVDKAGNKSKTVSK